MSEFTLPALPYAYNALEPYVSEQIMRLHHDKHHQAYVNNLNAAVTKQATLLGSRDLLQQIDLQTAIRFNGGGHINHSLFWQNLAPTDSPETDVDESQIKRHLHEQWGDFDGFKKEMTAALTGIQGSGWAWLVERPDGSLAIETTKDQDPVSQGHPLLGIDIWEHAYYLQYYNDKASYVDGIFHVINWQTVDSRFNGTQIYNELLL